jgi:hypothetical protein
MTTFLIVLDKDGKVQRLLRPSTDAELDSLCAVHMRKNLILVTGKTEPIMLQLCKIIDDLRDQLNRKTDFDCFFNELKNLIARWDKYHE